MDSKTRELIHKIAAEPGKTSSRAGGKSVKRKKDISLIGWDSETTGKLPEAAKHASSTEDIGERMVRDLIEGARRNRNATVQMASSEETKLASANLTPVDVAQLRGNLQALDEAGFTLKQAAEMLNLPDQLLETVMKVGFELPKLTPAWDHGLDVAGLGLLAIPEIAHLAQSKETKDKILPAIELAGLGVLAAPSALHLMHR